MCPPQGTVTYGVKFYSRIKCFSVSAVTSGGDFNPKNLFGDVNSPKVADFSQIPDDLVEVSDQKVDPLGMLPRNFLSCGTS